MTFSNTIASSSKIKVCVINPNFYRSSGVTVAIKRIDQAASNFGVDSFFVTCSKLNLDDDVDWIPPNRIQSFNLMTLNIFLLIREIFRFLSWLISNEVKVVHVHHRRLAIILKLPSIFLPFNIIYSANLTYKFNFLFWLFSPKNIVAISKSVKFNVIKTARATRILELGNPTNFPIYCLNNRLCADKKQAVCVARLELVKGHLALIEAWGLLEKKGLFFKLLLIGEGSLLGDLRRRVSELKLDSLITFCGYTSDVLSQYENSLFSILVSEVEGQGIVTIEAAAAGRASLLTDVDGSRDCLPSNRLLPNGLKYGDINSLTNALEYWFDHPEVVLDEGQNFYEFHNKLNSYEVLGEKYANIYKQA